ncbi:MAG: hypothetical protein Q8P81_01735 [Nanoarchaeota archaeon]|nr:hypothetical protein [Nanoarchaeota archaeon]
MEYEQRLAKIVNRFDRGFDLCMSPAEKILMREQLKKVRFGEDIGTVATRFLEEMGYQTKRFQELLSESNKREELTACTWFELYVESL